MTKPLTPNEALARAEFLNDWPGNAWNLEPANGKRFYLGAATRTMRVLRRLGFEVLPRKTVRVKRKAAKRVR